jgi:hypothetical protein
MSDCDVEQRTHQLGFTVEAPNVSIVVGFARAQSDLNAPAPYIANTGTLKIGENLPPGKPAIVDPCLVVGEPIVATIGDAAVKVRYADGREQDIQNTIPHAPPGKYYDKIVWGVHPIQDGLRSDGSTGATCEIRFDGTLKARS